MEFNCAWIKLLRSLCEYLFPQKRSDLSITTVLAICIVFKVNVCPEVMAVGPEHLLEHGRAARMPGELEELEGDPRQLGPEVEEAEVEVGEVLQHIPPPRPPVEEVPDMGEEWAPLVWPMLGTTGEHGPCGSDSDSDSDGLPFRLPYRWGDITISPAQWEEGEEPVDVKAEEVTSSIPDCGRFNAAPGGDISGAWQSLAYKRTLPFHAKWEGRPLGTLHTAPPLREYKPRARKRSAGRKHQSFHPKLEGRPLGILRTSIPTHRQRCRRPKDIRAAKSVVSIAAIAEGLGDWSIPVSSHPRVLEAAVLHSPAAIAADANRHLGYDSDIEMEDAEELPPSYYQYLPAGEMWQDEMMIDSGFSSGNNSEDIEMSEREEISGIPDGFLESRERFRGFRFDTDTDRRSEDGLDGIE